MSDSGQDDVRPDDVHVADDVQDAQTDLKEGVEGEELQGELGDAYRTIAEFLATNQEDEGAQRLAAALDLMLAHRDKQLSQAMRVARTAVLMKGERDEALKLLRACANGLDSLFGVIRRLVGPQRMAEATDPNVYEAMMTALSFLRTVEKRRNARIKRELKLKEQEEKKIVTPGG